jgi:DNA repair protein RecO (recombination protein O)
LPDERTTGLILRTRPLTETSLIVQWLTPDLGRMATVAKGARRPKSPFRGKLDLYYEADFSFVRSRRSELHTLREVSLRSSHAGLRQDLARLQQAAYCALLMEQTTETETPLPEIFQMFACLLRRLEQRAPQALTIFAFEMQLLKQLGQAPDLPGSPLNPGTRLILEQAARGEEQILSQLSLSAAQTREIQRFLHGFLIYHLGKIPRGRSAALLVSSQDGAD